MAPGSAVQRDRTMLRIAGRTLRCIRGTPESSPILRGLSLLAPPPLLLPPVRDESHEGAECRGWLASARVIQKRTRKRCAPIIENADQRAGFHSIAHIAFER